MDISVIVCTHNPRKDYLRRALEALKAQSLPLEHWELLLVDNASAEPLAGIWDLSWHPNARLVREGTLGLTPARLRSIREAKADLLVFVDDDNVLEPNYLAEANAIAARWPMLGAWGGQCIGEFESPPPEWTRPHWPMLAIRTLDADCWSNQMDYNTMPNGAGMCVRQPIALKYADMVAASPARALLDRCGTSLASGGDNDLALLTCKLGYGTALFKALRLKHLIPDLRLTEAYLVRLCEGMSSSEMILVAIHKGIVKEPTPVRKLINYVRASLTTGPERKFRFATLRGEREGRRFVNAHQSLFH